MSVTMALNDLEEDADKAGLSSPIGVRVAAARSSAIMFQLLVCCISYSVTLWAASWRGYVKEGIPRLAGRCSMAKLGLVAISR